MDNLPQPFFTEDYFQAMNPQDKYRLFYLYTGRNNPTQSQLNNYQLMSMMANNIFRNKYPELYMQYTGRGY